MPPFSLLHALRQREIGSTKDLKTWLVEKTRKGLSTGTSVKKSLELQEDTNYKDRCGNFVITTQRGILTLYDISINKKIWSLPLPDVSEHGYEYSNPQFKVYGDGIVTCAVSKIRWEPAFKPLILIFHQGKLCGEIIDVSLATDSLICVHGRIFALSIDRKSLYEWKKTGELIRTLPFDSEERKFGYPIFITHHDDLLVITGQPQGEERKAHIFSLDFNSNEYRIDNIIFAENYNISRISLYENKIILEEQHNHQDPIQRLDSKIAVYNILTRELEIEYPLQGVKDDILRMFATEHAIIFLRGKWSTEINVFCLNIKNKLVELITTLPMCSEGGYPGSINISSLGNLLMIGHPAGYWNYGWSASYLKVIDLDTLQIIKNTEYKRFPFFNYFSLENGILFNCTDFKNRTFLIQDFSAVKQPEAEAIASSNAAVPQA